MEHQITHPYERGVSSTFFGQVMSLFALAMASSAIGTYVGFRYALVYLAQHPNTMWLVFIAELVLIFTSQFWKNTKLGTLLFAGFTFLSGFTLAPLLAVIGAQFGGALIYKALSATAMTFIASGLIGWRTDWNLMGLRGFLFTALIGMIIVSIIGFFVPWGSTFEMIFSGFGVILFSGYTMYDFQRIKYQDHGHPITAAMSLYLDMFNLFIFILRLMSSMRNN